MTHSKALIHTYVHQTDFKILKTIAAVLGGVILMSLLAQVRIVLPWTPVPITGQTFGVAVLALLWGSRLSLVTFATYLFFGAIGAPIFAGGISGLTVGPTLGYLGGMLIASIVVGRLSDRGWANHFKTALGASYIGSMIIFSCGVFGLSFYIPKDQLFIAGVLPFLPGDLIKNILAAAIASQSTKIKN